MSTARFRSIRGMWICGMIYLVPLLLCFLGPFVRASGANEVIQITLGRMDTFGPFPADRVDVPVQIELKLPNVVGDKGEVVFDIRIELEYQISGRPSYTPLAEHRIRGSFAGGSVQLPVKPLRLPKKRNIVRAVISELRPKDLSVSAKLEATPIVTILLEREPRLHALLVGVEEYSAPIGATGSNWGPLCYPGHDARALEQYFEELKNVKYRGPQELLSALKTPPNVQTLTKAVDTTSKKIENEFHRTIRNASSEDTVLFFFSGHGWYSGEPDTPLLLAPSDGVFHGADVISMQGNNIKFDSLKTMFKPALANGDLARLIVILDTCDSGAAAEAGDVGKAIIVGATAPKEPAIEGLIPCIPDGRSDQPRDEQRIGVFTEVLLDALRGRIQGTVHKDGVEIISLVTVFAHLENKLGKYQNPSLRWSGGPLWLPVLRSN